MDEWDIVLVLSVLITFVGGFAGIAWKFASMITELKTLIVNLSNTIERIENDQERDKQQIMDKIEDHDLRLRQVEKEVIKLGENK